MEAVQMRTLKKLAGRALRLCLALLLTVPALAVEPLSAEQRLSLIHI